MLYVGTLSFDTRGREPQHGFFTCVVDAPSADDAIEAMEAKTREAHDRVELFRGDTVVHLEHLVAVPAIPSSGLLLNYTSLPGQCFATVNCSLPVEAAGCEEFGVEGDEEGEVEPLVRFAPPETPSDTPAVRTDATEVPGEDAGEETDDEVEPDDEDENDESGYGCYGDLTDAPVFLVRWPNLSACLVRAHNERHVMDMLDELADPGTCSIEEYEGPLWIEFEMPVGVELRGSESDTPGTRDDLVLTGLEDIDPEAFVLQPSIPGADTGYEMHDLMMRRVFAATREALHELADPGENEHAEPPSPSDVAARLREALCDDLGPLLRAQWRFRQMKRRAALGDRDAGRLHLMGLTVDLSPPKLRDPQEPPPPSDE